MKTKRQKKTMSLIMAMLIVINGCLPEYALGNDQFSAEDDLAVISDDSGQWNAFAEEDSFAGEDNEDGQSDDLFLDESFSDDYLYADGNSSDDYFYSDMVTEETSIPEDLSIIVPEEMEETEDISESTEDVWTDEEQTEEDLSVFEDLTESEGLLADAAPVYYSGTCGSEGNNGDNLEWVLSGTTLTITGTGRMRDFGNAPTAPWGYSTLLRYVDITEIRIGEGCTYIGRNAFGGNSKLTSVNLPDSIKEIGANAFSGCKSMPVPHWPTNLKYLDSFAFAGCEAFTDITLPEGLLEIDQCVFRGCEYLTHIKLPSTLTELYGSAFGATGLRTIGPVGSGFDVEIPWGYGKEIPDRINFGYTYSSLAESGYYTPITKVVFPEGITKIPDSICSRMDCLEEFIIPDTVITIGGSAFSDNESLKKVDLSDRTGLSLIRNSAFSYCKNLEEIIFPDQVAMEGGVIANDPALTKVHLPETMTELPNHTFENCTALTEDSFTWPSGLTTIGSEVFEGCSALKKIVIPNHVRKLKTEAFEDCTGLVSVYIPAECTEFDYSVFTGCHSLLSAGPAGDGNTYHITYGWTESIPDYAFYKSPIKTVVFPETMKQIGECSFGWCDRLKKVFLPASVEEIHSSAFTNCDTLETVRLPKNIKRISSYAFTNCPQLKKILFRGDAPEMWGGVFDHITAYYPKGNTTWTYDLLYDFYWEDVTWKPYGPGENLDMSREREATLNSQGTVSARFYLVDEDGNPMPEVRFRYQRRGDTYVEEFDNVELMTDTDGSYLFQTPYLEDNASHEHEIIFDSFELISEEDTELEEDLEFTLHVTIAPFACTETWTASLGGTMKLKGKITSLGGSSGSSAEIELKHKEDGKQNLKLSLSLTESVEGALKNKLKKFGGDPGQLGLRILSGSASAKAELKNTYSVEIENYEPSNASHQEIVSCYLGMLLLANNASMEVQGITIPGGGLLNNILFSRAVDKLYALNFDGTGQTLTGTVSGSGSVFTLENSVTGGVLGEFSVGSTSGSSNFSLSVSEEPDGKTKWKTSSKQENFAALVSADIMSLAGVRGLVGTLQVNDYSVSADSTGSLSISACTYDSGLTEAVGWDDVYQYHTLKADGESANEIEKANGGMIVNNIRNGLPLPLLPNTWSRIRDSFARSKKAVTWQDTEKLTRSISWKPSVTIVEKLLDLSANISFVHGWSTEVDNGIYQDETVLLEADSAFNMQNAINSGGNWSDLAAILASPFTYFASSVESLVSSASKTFGSVVSCGKASVSTKSGSNAGWKVSVIGSAGSAGRTVQSESVGELAEDLAAGWDSVSYEIVTTMAGQDMADGETQSGEAVRAMTVGEAYEIVVTDGDGNIQGEIPSDNAPVITLGYSQEDLLAAGGDDPSGLAVYRLDTDRGNYVYVGGDVSVEDGTVSASISKPGQYVLALDGAGISVSGISLEDHYLSAMISAFTGIQQGEILLDDEVIIKNKGYNNFWRYYSAETGIFSGYSFYPEPGEHTLVFRLTDGRGDTSDVSHTFTVYEEPEITEAQIRESCWYGQEIPVRVKIDAAEEQMNALVVWADVSLSGLAQDNEIVYFQKEGDWWTLSYPVKRKYDRYRFYVRAKDSSGQMSEGETLTSEIESQVTLEQDGMTIEFDRQRGKIISVETDKQDVALPSKIEGIPVKIIGEDALKGNQTMRTLTIPEGIICIEEWAFSGCTKLTKVSLPDSLLVVQEYAFYKCTSLKHVDLPETTVTVQECAFGYVQGNYGATPISDFTLGGNSSVAEQYRKAFREDLEYAGNSGYDDDDYNDDDDQGENETGQGTSGSSGYASGASNTGNGTGSGLAAGSGTGSGPAAGISADVKISSLSLSAAPSTKIAVGKKATLTAEVLPENAFNKTLTWTSSNPKFASVSASGVVTAQKAGKGKKVVITAHATDGSGKTASITINITKNPVKKVTIKASSKKINAGKSLKLKADVKAGAGANKKLKWISSSNQWATVSSSGKVSTKKAGKGKTVTITAQATDGSGKKAKIKIKIV